VLPGQGEKGAARFAIWHSKTALGVFELNLTTNVLALSLAGTWRPLASVVSTAANAADEAGATPAGTAGVWVTGGVAPVAFPRPPEGRRGKRASRGPHAARAKDRPRNFRAYRKVVNSLLVTTGYYMNNIKKSNIYMNNTIFIRFLMDFHKNGTT